MARDDLAHCYKAEDAVLLDPEADKATGMREVLTKNVKRKLRSLWGKPAFTSLRNYYAGLGSCLLYHRIVDSRSCLDEFSPYSGLSVTIDRFEEQLSYLKKHFNCISLPRAINLLKEGQLPARSIILTFDDGYKDNLTNALPLLEKYEIPATIYITTGLVDRSEQLWWYEQEFIIRNSSTLDFTWNSSAYKWHFKNREERYSAIDSLNRLCRQLPTEQQHSFMHALRASSTSAYSYDAEVLTWAEVEKLDSHPLISIGAHTKSHPMLNLLSKAQLTEELQDSKVSLEQHLAHPIDHLAYPFGGLNEIGAASLETAKNCGFSSAVTTRHGHLYPQHGKHLLSLPRISINDTDEPESFSWKLCGIYCLLQQYGQRLAVA